MRPLGVYHTKRFQEPLSDAKSALVLETFAWTAVVQLGFRLSFGVGAYVLAPFVNLALNHNGAAFIGYILLPYLAYLYLQLPVSDETHRFHLLSFAATEGVVIGFLLSRRYLASLQPLDAITPLVIALSIHLLGPKLANNRPALYGAAIGGGVAVHLLFGLMGGQLSAPYFVLTLLHAAIGFALLQTLYKFGTSSVSLPTFPTEPFSKNDLFRLRATCTRMRTSRWRSSLRDSCSGSSAAQPRPLNKPSRAARCAHWHLISPMRLRTN